MVETAGEIEEELQHKIREFGQAWASSDIPRLDQLLAPEYLHTDYLGRNMGRDEWLAYASATRPVDNIEFVDLKVKLYSDVAVVTGKNEIRGRAGAGDTNVDIRFTQVWVRENSDWKRAFFQATPVA